MRVIAEVGLTHFGSFDLAKLSIDQACEAGAWAWKTQAFRPGSLTEDKDWQERLRGRWLDEHSLHRLADYCHDVGINFLLTPHDDWGLGLMKDLGLKLVKIGSGEVDNWPFIMRIYDELEPDCVIQSLGMWDRAGIREAHALATDAPEFNIEEWIPMHCVSAYPVPLDQANLGAIGTLRAWLKPDDVGYSDHTGEVFMGALAVAAGASLLEVHFHPFDLAPYVPDSNDMKVSLNPSGLREYIRQAERCEAAMGEGGLEPMPCEEETAEWARKDPKTNRRGATKS